jgi:hypothetical protein
MTAVLEQIESYISMLPNVPEEVLTMVAASTSRAGSLT